MKAGRAQNSLPQMPRSPEKRVKSRVGPYELFEVLSETPRSTIFRGQEVHTNTVVTVKRIPLRYLSQPGLDKLLSSKLVHRNVCRLRGSFKDAEFIYLAHEYANRGSLAAHLAEMGGVLGVEDARYVTREVAKGLERLGSAGIAHMDLKPESVLLSSQGLAVEVKLSDAGDSIFNLEAKNNHARIPDPESAEKADVWLLGELLLRMISSAEQSQEDLPPPEGEIRVRSPFELPPTCLDFLSACLQSAAVRRPGWRELLMHPFIESEVMPGAAPEGYSFDGMYHTYTVSTVERRPILGPAAVKAVPPEVKGSDIGQVIAERIEVLTKEVETMTRRTKELEEAKSKSEKESAEMIRELKRQVKAEGNRLLAEERRARQTYIDLRSLIKSSGGYVDVIEVANIPDGVRKVIARRNIGNGRDILFVPDKLITMLSQIQDYGIIKRAREVGVKYTYPTNSQFSMWCLEEQEKPDSPHRLFLKAFLTKVNNYPLFYPEKDLALLKGSPMIGTTP